MQEKFENSFHEMGWVVFFSFFPPLFFQFCTFVSEIRNHLNFLFLFFQAWMSFALFTLGLFSQIVVSAFFWICCFNHSFYLTTFTLSFPPERFFQLIEMYTFSFSLVMEFLWRSFHSKYFFIVRILWMALTKRLSNSMLKLRHYNALWEGLKIWKISNLFWQNRCFYSVVSKQVGDFFKILWPFQKSWTSHKNYGNFLLLLN